MGSAPIAVEPLLRPVLHCLDYSDPGGGKTTFACTWPKPMLVTFFDGIGKDMPYLRWARETGCTTTDDVSEVGTRRKHIWSPDPAVTLPLITIEYYNDIAEGSRDWESFQFRLQHRAFLDEGYITLVLDSLTFMELCARKYFAFMNPRMTKDPRRLFGGSTDYLEDAVITQLGGLVMNVLLIAHIDTDKDEFSGQMLRNPAAPGRLNSRKILAASFSELYRSYVVRNDDGTKSYLLQTQSDQMFNCASQIGAPDPCWADYNELWANWR